MDIIVYTSDWFDKLSDFMFKQYPNRSKEFLLYWLHRMVDSGGDKRTLLAVENGIVYGCTTSVYVRMRLLGNERKVYWECNTIIDKVQRGKGIGRKLYEAMNGFKDRLTVGFTDAAWQIQPQLIDGFRKISPVRVYISIGIYGLKNLLEGMFKIRRQEMSLYIPPIIDSGNYFFKKISYVNELHIPDSNGYWLNDCAELARDKQFFLTRFEEIYREYIIYEGIEKNETFGYFVVRPTEYRGIRMLSLVDYRVVNPILFARIRKAVMNVAYVNKIGLSIMLTSQRIPFITFFPFTIRLKKKLYAATSVPEIKDNSDILITSADSDLDFVYYK
ncbi:GNAT family N-acetyltransferase [Parabacteroides distasonis]|uniref:GNAT family N-acetyltransferase n=1 Tax=Parabacteroides distasonis TaxID=823 RepID=UPI0018AA9395|nr:GNAT family N-acetyltransferase [Parabacteroides distasonis]